jgi:hypothetical protein
MKIKLKEDLREVTISEEGISSTTDIVYELIGPALISMGHDPDNVAEAFLEYADNYYASDDVDDTEDDSYFEDEDEDEGHFEPFREGDVVRSKVYPEVKITLTEENIEDGGVRFSGSVFSFDEFELVSFSDDEDEEEITFLDLDGSLMTDAEDHASQPSMGESEGYVGSDDDEEDDPDKTKVSVVEYV